ncbi:MAG TPA: TetR/AcrR family transcriptional regulator [Kofleriaceae bacterium]|nr:TetR/AcrR family transcriptional regulator [Kofleriaceae bacterium]
MNEFRPPEKMSPSAPRESAPRAPRRRRLPTEARQEILQAAERVFAKSHADAVGLKEIAEEAGVSHALVTHYFGTFGGLVDAVLEQRVVALRERMLARMAEPSALSRPGELLTMLFDSLEEPVYKRLWMWVLATERSAAADFFPLRQKGLRQVAEQLATAIAEATGAPAVALVPEVERMLLIAVSTAYGYTVGKPALVGALGKTPSREVDRALQESLGEMIREHLFRFAARVQGAGSQ